MKKSKNLIKKTRLSVDKNTTVASYQVSEIIANSNKAQVISYYLCCSKTMQNNPWRSSRNNNQISSAFEQGTYAGTAEESTLTECSQTMFNVQFCKKLKMYQSHRYTISVYPLQNLTISNLSYYGTTVRINYKRRLVWDRQYSYSCHIASSLLKALHVYSTLATMK